MAVPYVLQNLWETRKKTILFGGGAILILLIILVVLIFTIPRGPVVTPSAVPLDDVELTWWKPDLNGMRLSEYRELIKIFESENRNVKINLINKPYGDNYYREIIEDMALGVGPDIFTIHNNDLPAYISYLSPISVFQGQDSSGKGRLAQYQQDFADLVVKDTIFQNEVYGITHYVENLQMYVNRDLLDQASIALPAQTWDDLDVQIPKLTRENVNRTGFEQSAISLGTGNIIGAVPNIVRHQDIIPMLLFQSGQEIYDPILGQSVLDEKEEATLRALEFYYSFADQSSSRYTWSLRSPNNVEAFTSGKLAYMIHYSFFESEIQTRNPRLNYQVVPLPQLNPNNRQTYGFFFMDTLSRNLRNENTSYAKRYWAEQFMLFLSSTEAQTVLAANTNFPAARKDVINEQLKGNLTQQIFAEGALYADNYYKPDVERAEEIWSEMMFEIHYRSDVDIEDALDAAIREYQRLVLDGPRRR